MAKKTAKKPAAKAAAPAMPKPAKLTAASKPRSKGEIYKIISEHTGVHRKHVGNVFETLGKILEVDLGKSTPVNVGGLMKVQVRHRPATPARKGIDPFTKQERMFKAKPARNVIKVRPLKMLKDMV